MSLSALGFSYWSAWGWVDGWMFYGVTTLNNIKTHQALGAANNSIGATATYSFGLEALFTFIILVIGTFLIYKWLSKKTYEELSQLIIVAIAGIAVVYVSNSIVNTMKVNWGRFRPYEIKEIVSSTKEHSLIAGIKWVHRTSVIPVRTYDCSGSSTLFTIFC